MGFVLPQIKKKWNHCNIFHVLILQVPRWTIPASAYGEVWHELHDWQGDRLQHGLLPVCPGNDKFRVNINTYLLTWIHWSGGVLIIRYLLINNNILFVLLTHLPLVRCWTWFQFPKGSNTEPIVGRAVGKEATTTLSSESFVITWTLLSTGNCTTVHICTNLYIWNNSRQFTYLFFSLLFLLVFDLFCTTSVRIMPWFHSCFIRVSFIFHSYFLRRDNTNPTFRRIRLSDIALSEGSHHASMKLESGPSFIDMSIHMKI